MASSAPACSNCLSCADLFHSQGRHFVTVMSLALILVDNYNPSPIMVEYLFEGTCLLQSMFALALAFVGSKILSVACFFIVALVFIVSTPMLFYLVKLKPNAPFIFFTSCVDVLLILGRKIIIEV